MIAAAAPSPLDVLPPDIASQLATMAGLLAPVAVSAIRRRLDGRPKWVLPALCGALGVGISILAQLAASLASEADTGGWVFAFRVVVGVAWAGLGLLARELGHGWQTGERIDNRPKLKRAMDRLGNYRPGRGAGLLILAMLSPAGAAAQALEPGVGLSLLPGDLVQIATSNPDFCPRIYRRVVGSSGGPVDPSLDPWSVLGVPPTVGLGSIVPVPGAVYTRDEETGIWSGSALLAGSLYSITASSEAGAKAVLAREAWQQLAARRYVPRAPQGAKCLLPGPTATNHGTGTRSRSEALCRAGEVLRTSRGVTWLDPTGRNCVMTEAERTDAYYSKSLYARLSAAAGGGSPPDPDPCAATGWRCHPLVELPPAEQVGADSPQGPVRARAVGTGTPAPAGAVSYAGWIDLYGLLYVRPFVAGAFAGLPDDCQTVDDLRPECWDPQPTDPDPPPPDPPCPSCPEPDPVHARIELEGCSPARGVVIVDDGESMPFSPGILSTGRITLELVEHSGTCPPPPPPAPCEPQPCDPGPTDPDPPPPPPEPGWEVLWEAPHGWEWTTGATPPPAPVLELEVPNHEPFRGLRVSYTVVPRWSRCVELPGPSPSPKCLGMFITSRSSANRVFSYLMVQQRSVTLRHGFVRRFGATPKRSMPFRMLDGREYRVVQEVVDGQSSVTITADGQGVGVLRGSRSCSSAPCFPERFPAQPVVLRAGWRGDEPLETGGTMGWRVTRLRVEVQR